ncbi:hypothetical protein ACU4GG_41965 [Streptomyces nojiriensis]
MIEARRIPGAASASADEETVLVTAHQDGVLVFSATVTAGTHGR